MTRWSSGDSLSPSMLNLRAQSPTTVGGYSTNTLAAESGNTVRLTNGQDWIARSYDSGGAGLNLYAFGPAADGITDDAGVFQTALNAAQVASGVTGSGLEVLVPAGNYRLASTITIPHGVTLRGLDWTKSQQSRYFSGPVLSITSGTIVMGKNTRVTGFTIFYSTQTYSPTVDLSQPDGISSLSSFLPTFIGGDFGITLDNLNYFGGTSIFSSTDNCARFEARNIFGMPTAYGFRLRDAGDYCYFENILFNPGILTNAFAPHSNTANLFTKIAKNLTVFRFGRVDGAQLVNCFAFAARDFIHVEEVTGTTSFSCDVFGGGADNCWSAYRIEGINTDTDIRIFGGVYRPSVYSAVDRNGSVTTLAPTFIRFSGNASANDVLVCSVRCSSNTESNISDSGFYVTPFRRDESAAQANSIVVVGSHFDRYTSSNVSLIGGVGVVPLHIRSSYFVQEGVSFDRNFSSEAFGARLRDYSSLWSREETIPAWYVSGPASSRLSQFQLMRWNNLAIQEGESNVHKVLVKYGGAELGSNSWYPQIELEAATQGRVWLGRSVTQQSVMSSGVNLKNTPGLVILNRAAGTTLDVGDAVTLVDTGASTVTIQLPAAAQFLGAVYVLKKIASANILGITVTGGDTLDGSTSTQLSSRYAALTVQSDGTNWHILTKYLS